MQKQNRDIVREAVSLFQQLQQRRAQLQSELNEIDQALASVQGGTVTSNQVSTPTPGRRGRGSNAMSLREVVLQVLGSGPKTKEEILEGIGRTSYRFSAAKPMNSLQTFLYGPGKKLLKRSGKQFSLAGGAAQGAAAGGGRRKMSAAARKRISEAAKARWAKQKGGASAKSAAVKPAKARRKMSAEARKRISEAAKARWAKQKAAQG